MVGPVMNWNDMDDDPARPQHAGDCGQRVRDVEYVLDSAAVEYRAKPGQEMRWRIVVVQIEQEICALIRADIEAVRLPDTTQTHHLVRSGKAPRFICRLCAPDGGAKLGRCEINV